MNPDIEELMKQRKLVLEQYKVLAGEANKEVSRALRDIAYISEGKCFETTEHHPMISVIPFDAKGMPYYYRIDKYIEGFAGNDMVDVIGTYTFCPDSWVEFGSNKEIRHNVYHKEIPVEEFERILSEAKEKKKLNKKQNENRD